MGRHYRRGQQVKRPQNDCPLCKGKKTAGALLCAGCRNSKAGRWFARSSEARTRTAGAERTAEYRGTTR